MAGTGRALGGHCADRDGPRAPPPKGGGTQGVRGIGGPLVERTTDFSFLSGFERFELSVSTCGDRQKK